MEVAPECEQRQPGEKKKERSQTFRTLISAMAGGRENLKIQKLKQWQSPS